MAIITVPSTVHFETVETFRLQRGGLTLRSRYNGRRQAVVFPFALWVFEGSLLPKSGTDAGLWRSFLVQLDGQKNTFRLPVPGHAKPLSGFTYSTANVMVQTAAVAGAQSISVGVSIGNVPLFVEGDYFTVNDELKVATAPVTLNGSGIATVSFKPALRRPVTPGTVVTVFNPTMLMQDQDDGTGWGLSRPVQHGIKLKLMEAYE